MDFRESKYLIIKESEIAAILKNSLREFFENPQPSAHFKKPPDQEPLISTREALEFLGGVDRHTLYKYIKEGLSSYRCGRSHKFRKSELQSFILNKKS